jgi:hypothetical protein
MCPRGTTGTPPQSPRRRQSRTTPLRTACRPPAQGRHCTTPPGTAHSRPATTPRQLHWSRTCPADTGCRTSAGRQPVHRTPGDTECKGRCWRCRTSRRCTACTWCRRCQRCQGTSRTARRRRWRCTSPLHMACTAQCHCRSRTRRCTACTWCRRCQRCPGTSRTARRRCWSCTFPPGSCCTSSALWSLDMSPPRRVDRTPGRCSRRSSRRGTGCSRLPTASLCEWCRSRQCSSSTTSGRQSSTFLQGTGHSSSAQNGRCTSPLRMACTARCHCRSRTRRYTACTWCHRCQRCPGTSRTARCRCWRCTFPPGSCCTSSSEWSLDMSLPGRVGRTPGRCSRRSSRRGTGCSR